MKLPSYEREYIEDIHKRNREFLELRENKKRLRMFAEIEEVVESKLEIALTDSSNKKVGKDQLMFVF
ncbi:hypothetical protein CVD28_18550 [Bacillus sp. M6-12]|nr:hypothetical protein CVD28_18550 [Bacillus sp. M6-12]